MGPRPVQKQQQMQFKAERVPRGLTPKMETLGQRDKCLSQQLWQSWKENLRL